MTLQVLILLLLLAGLLVCIPVIVSLWPKSESPEPAAADAKPARRPARASLSPEIVALLKQWYAGRSCALCQRPIAKIHGEPRPGLFNAGTRQTLSWNDIPPDQIPAALQTHLPVCANCNTAESFRREFPDLVVDRATTPHRDSAVH